MQQQRFCILLLLIVLLLNACTSTDTSPSSDSTSDSNQTSPDNIRSIVIGFGAMEFQRAFYEPLIVQFNTENPDIHVQFVALDQALQTSDERPLDSTHVASQIARSADTFAPFLIQTDDIKRGYYHDLTPFIDADPGFNRDDFYLNVLNAYSQDGATYIIPHTIRLPLLTYNKELLASHGISEITSDWKWNDLIAISQQVAQKQNGNIETYGFFRHHQGLYECFVAKTAIMAQKHR